MAFRIPEEYANNSILPFLQFLTVIPDSEFVEAMSSILNETGFSRYDCHCIFSSDFETWEEEYFEGGVKFDNDALEEVVIVDYETFQKYVIMACKSYLKDYPEHKQILSDLIQNFSEKYKLLFKGL